METETKGSQVKTEEDDVKGGTVLRNGTSEGISAERPVTNIGIRSERNDTGDGSNVERNDKSDEICDKNEGIDVEGKHKCQLCQQSFVERQTLDEHVEHCDLFDGYKDTSIKYKKPSSRINIESSKERDEKSKKGIPFYQVIDIEKIKANFVKDNGNKAKQVVHKDKEYEKEDVTAKLDNPDRKTNPAKGKGAKVDARKSVKYTKTDSENIESYIGNPDRDFKKAETDIENPETDIGNTEIDLENPVVDSISVSKSGRKRKIKSFADYETDLSFIKRPSKRHLQSVDNSKANITTESKLQGDTKSKFDNKDEGKGGTCLEFGSKRKKMSVKFMCPLCPEEGLDIESMQGHLKQKHDQQQLDWKDLLSEKNSKMEDLVGDLASTVLQGEKACPFCKECFQTTELWTQHVNSNHAGTLYCCGICSQAYSTRKVATLHMKEHHLNLQYPCNHCNKQFKTSKDLMTHTKKLHKKTTQYKTNNGVERNEYKLAGDYEIDDDVSDGTGKTQEFEKEKNAEVKLCKTFDTGDIDEQTVANKEVKTRCSGPIVVKSAKVIPKKDKAYSEKGDQKIEADENTFIDSMVDLSDTDEDTEGVEILSEQNSRPFDNHSDITDKNIEQKSPLDFSRIKDVKYECCFEYCGSILQEFSSWRKHIYSHISYKKTEYKYAPLECIECGYSTKIKPVFVQHVLTKHSNLGSVEINLEHCRILDQTTSEPVKIMTCVFCCLTGDSRQPLAQHKCNRKKVHFYCPFCEMKDERFENLQEHIKGDHSDKTIHRQVLGEKFKSLRTAKHDPAYKIGSTETKCLTCKQEFETNDELKLHANEAHAIGPYSCGVCRQCYGRRGAVKDHMKKTHSLPLVCQHCKRGFGDKADLARHEATHLKTKPFKCDLCVARFSDQKGLTVHYRYKHTEYSATTEGKALEKMNTESKPELFICDICGITLKSILQYKNHAKNHQLVDQDNVTEINCEICSKKFTSRNIYNRHLCIKAIEGSEPYIVPGQKDSVQSVRELFEKIKQNPTPGTNAVVKCGLCQKDFNKNKYLFNHIRQIHLPNEGKRIHCSVCGSGFSRKAQLLCHMRSHSKTKPFLCKICGKRFRQLGHVKVHLLSHSAQALFNCELCTQVFKTKGGLKNHISKHCDIYPYECFVKSCNRSFVSLNNLLLHVRNCNDLIMQENSLECKLCSNMKLDDLKAGLVHMKSHSKDSFYKCKMCPCDFITYRALYNHKAKLKHFSELEKETAANQTIHTQNFKFESIEGDHNMDMVNLQEQYEFTPDPYEAEEIQVTITEQAAEYEGDDEEGKVIESEELMDIAEQLTHMAQSNMFNGENLVVKTFPNEGNLVVESVETVIEDYSDEFFTAPSVDMSVPTSKYNQYNSLIGFDVNNTLSANLINNQHKSPSKFKLVQNDTSDLSIQNKHMTLRDQDDNHIEVLASHPVIDESAVLVSRTPLRKNMLTNDFNTEIVRANNNMPETPTEDNSEIKTEADTVCIEMLNIPTIYDKFGREVKVNVINEEGHEIPFQSNQELLQALLTTGNYSIGYNQSDVVSNELTENTSSIVKGSKEIIPNFDNVQQMEIKTDLGICPNNTEIYVIDEVQGTEQDVQLDATNQISSQKGRKQKQNILNAERNIDNVPGEITDKEANSNRSKPDNGTINYKVRLNYYEDRTKNEEVYHLKCKECPRRFSRVKDLNRHKKIHLPNDERKFKCKECGKGYVTKDNLLCHMLVHSGGRPHKCNQCNKSFRQLGHLQTHIRVHTNYRPFKCTNCEKTFATNSQLKAHVKKHGIHFKKGLDNCVACLICGNTFASEKHLNVHKITHISSEAKCELVENYNALGQKKEEKDKLEQSGSKKHMCDECGQMFSQLSSLKDHKHIHQPESKQTCEECGHEFFTMKRLHFHMKHVHSSIEKWQCDICGQNFKLKTSFNAHIRHNHREPKFQCKKCQQKFHRRYVFLKHMPSCIGEEILQPVQ